MLKTNRNKVAKPGKPFIIIGVLKGYIKGAIGFFIMTMLTFSSFKKTIDMDLPKEFIDSAGLMAWLYIRLKKKVDQEKAFEIVRATILPLGLILQQAGFRNVEDIRNFQNIVKYQKRAKEEGNTKLNTMEIISETEKLYEFRICKCMFFEFFKKMGVVELTSIMCGIDNAIFNSYQPETIVFHRNGVGNRIVDGAEYCSFVIEDRN